MTTMHHPDEQILALFAVGADLAGPQQTMIEDHLRACAGCRAQFEELRSINDLVADRSAASDGPSPYTIEAIERVAHAARRIQAAPSRRTPRHMVTPMQRAAWLVRSHPIISGTGAMLLGVAAVALILQINTHRLRAGQPVAVVLNPVSTAMIVVNQDGESLCEIPVSPERSADADARDLKFNTRFFDIDDDGRMEIVTTAPYNEGTAPRDNVVRTFSADGRLIRTSTFGMPVSFGDRHYNNSYSSLGLLIRNHAGQTEYLVSINNYRSPSCLIRMTPDGTIIGEYWHFGWMNNPSPVHLSGTDRDAVLLVGADDSHDLEGVVTASLVVLDPDRITGRTESGITRGFGFERSSAEVMYVTTGHPDPALLDTAMIQHTGFRPLVRFGEDSTVTVCAKGLTETLYSSLHYTFPADFGIPTIYASDLSLSLLSEHFLVNRGPDGISEFFRHMASRVRYWDGQHWQPTPVRITLSQPGR